MSNVLLGSMLLFVCIGLLIIGLSIPLMLRRVKPNAWYGFRTRKTLSNEIMWYHANAYSGRLLCGVGIIHTITSMLLSLILPSDIVLYNMICVVILLGSLLVALLLSVRYLHSL